MLPRDALKLRVQSGQIELGYAFDVASTPVVRIDPEVCVEFSQPPSVADAMFDANFFGDRLGLTLGPVAYSHEAINVPGRKMFKNRPGTIDLQQMGGSFTIAPRETLTVHTVERVRLGSSTAALVLPRLTLATAGLAVVPSYIDPFWDGILQLSLTNLTDSRYELRLGERIAICRFYDIAGAPLPDTVKNQFANKSHHFGLTWQRVLDTDDDPMPRRKMPTSVSLADQALTLLRRLGRYGKYLLGGVGVLAVIASALIAYGRFTNAADRINEIDKEASQASEIAREAAASAKSLTTRLPIQGTASLEFASGALTATADVELNQEVSAASVVVVQILPASSGMVASGTVLPARVSGHSILRITLLRRAMAAGSAGPALVAYLVA